VQGRDEERETDRELYENGRSWEKRDLSGRREEITSLCYKVPRRHPFAIVIRTV
jgi:hypothetical protein